MKAFLSTLLVLGSLALSEARTSPHAQVAARRTVHQLLARQSIDPSTVPATCETQCQAVLDDLNRCADSTDVTCICNTTTENNFVDCFNCMLAVSSPTPDEVALAQTQLDQLVSVCNARGVVLPPASIGSASPADGDSDASNPLPTDTPDDSSFSTPTESVPLASDTSLPSTTPAAFIGPGSSSSSAAPAGPSGDYSSPTSGNGALASGGNLALAMFIALFTFGSLITI